MSGAVAPGAIIESAEQVRILLQEGGLRGRKLQGFAYPSLRIDEARLDDAHFERMALCESTFGNADLGRTRFVRVDLRRARYTDAVMVDASFEDCDLTEGTLLAAHLERVTFVRGSLSNLVASQSRLVDVSCTEANLYGLRLDGATLIRCRFSDPRPNTAVELTRSNLRGAVLIDCDLGGANLYRADLTGALLLRCNLEGATLTGVEAAGARLIDCRTLGADLPDVLRAPRAEAPESQPAAAPSRGSAPRSTE